MLVHISFIHRLAAHRERACDIAVGVHTRSLGWFRNNTQGTAMTNQTRSNPVTQQWHEPQRELRYYPPLTLVAPQAHANHLLAAMHAAGWKNCLSQLEYVPMPLGQVLYESGRSLSHIFFPTTAIVSLFYLCENGSSAVSALTGSEGVVGLPLLMGGGSRAINASVLRAGHGFRLRAQVMKDEFNSHSPLLHLFMRHTLALITQIMQTAACNRHHSVDQQLARWLLMSLDRSESRELAMTHELIATALGVRREGITAAALKLQAAGVIRYARGRITVLNRPALERLSCECYAVVKTEYDRLLPDSMTV